MLTCAIEVEEMERAAAVQRQGQGWKKNLPGVAPGGSRPLTMASPGVELTVERIRGRDETRRFLESLGFSEGAAVTVVTELNGSLIVNVRGARVALGKTMAARITVS